MPTVDELQRIAEAYELSATPQSIANTPRSLMAYDDSDILELFENTFKINGNYDYFTPSDEAVDRFAIDPDVVFLLDYLSSNPNFILPIVKNCLYGSANSGQVVINKELLYRMMLKKFMINTENGNLAFVFMSIKSIPAHIRNTIEFKDNWHLKMVVSNLKNSYTSKEELDSKVKQWRDVLNYLADFEMGSLEHAFYTQVVNEIKLQYRNDHEILTALNIKHSPRNISFLNLSLLFFSFCISSEEETEEEHNGSPTVRMGNSFTGKMTLY